MPSEKELQLLRRLIADLIDEEQWTPLEADVKGEVYDGLGSWA